MEVFRLSLNSPIKPSDISATLEKGYEYISSWRITINDRIRLLSSYSNIFVKLHYQRRRATIFQELAFAAAGTVAQRKSDNDQHSASQDSAPTVVKSASDSASNNAIMQLLDIACDTYGVPVVATAEIASGETDGEESTVQSDLTEATNIFMNRFGWASLQVALVKDAIHVAELLPDYQGAIRFTITALCELQNSLSSTDQYKFSQNISKLFAAASKRGSRYRMAYWGPQDLVMSLEVAS
jgi:hypothetical protein